MKLKAQRLNLILDWYASKLFKKYFLADKNVSHVKFDYWLKKYNALPKPPRVDPSVDGFKEFYFPNITTEVEFRKTIEPTNPCGIELTIYEKCYSV